MGRSCPQYGEILGGAATSYFAMRWSGFTFLLLFASLLPAATISDVTICEPGLGLGPSPGLAAVFGTTSCNSQIGTVESNTFFSAASAISNTSYSVNGNEVQIALHQEAITPALSWSAAYCNDIGGNCPNLPHEYASGTGTIDTEFTTSGPVRNGYFTFYITISGGYAETGGDIDSAAIYLGNFAYYCSGDAECSPNVPRLYWVPFTLGEPFAFRAVSTAVALNGYDSPGNEAGILLDAVFEFFEADQSTPVDLIEIPEPSSSGMIAVALCALAVAFVRMRDRRSC